MAPRREEATAEMRDSIQDRVLIWFDGNEWEDDLKAERIAEKIAEAPERFITPNPDSCGSYWEEASRIYQGIKDEYDLRTVSERVSEADDYDEQRKQFAAKKLRENAEAIRAGEKPTLVRGIEEDLGPEFVNEALRGTVADPDAKPEPATPSSQSKPQGSSGETSPQAALTDGGSDTNVITGEPTIDPESESTLGPEPELEDDGPPEHWPEKGEPVDLEDEYQMLRMYVKMVARGESDALMLEAPPGIGKSYQIMETLQDELPSDRFEKISGKATPLELYHTLYEVSDDRVLFIDDIDALIDNKDAVALLKQATWSEGETRRIEWRSTSSRLEVPDEFGFRGRIIMCFNEIPKDGDPNVEALKNRCLQYPIDFSHDERLQICREVAKKPYKDLSWEERMEVVDWIEDRAGPGDEVTLRLLFHVFDMRNFTEDEWEAMAEEQLEFDPELARIRELCKMDEHKTVKSVQEVWCDEFNYSRPTFFDRWEQIKEELEEGESLL